MMLIKQRIAVSGLLWLFSATLLLGADAVQEDLAKVRGVGREGAGFPGAREAADRLRALPASEISRVLDGFDQANPIAQNWLRGIVADVMRRQGKVPVEPLVAYVKDRKHNVEGRAVAMELIRQLNPEVEAPLVDECLDDPSLTLRALAVERAMARGVKAKEAKDTEGALKQYHVALEAARHPRQVEAILKSLKDLGETILAVEHFKFITEWKVIAPFDNTGGVGYEAPYDPELQFTKSKSLNLTQPLKGKAGMVQWQDLKTDDENGSVDLAKAFNKEKGAVCYAYAELKVAQALAGQVRLGTSCANKIWVNGIEATKNEVYHAGSMVDQYVADVALQPGGNRILLKICQNEQTEEWAQDWAFQFRVTDSTGKGLSNAK